MTPEVILTSLTLGLVASVSPCVIPLYPGFLAYLSGSQGLLDNQRSSYYLGFFVLAGVLTMMLILGAIIAFLSISIGRALTVVIPIADFLIILLGVLLLADINPFKKLPQVQVPLLTNPYINAFVYGLLYGPIALPCSGPLVVGIFALSFTAEEFFSKLWVFVWFGIGFGLPLFLLSFLSGASQRGLTRFFGQYSRAINIAAGALLVAVGIYDLAVNWENIMLFL